MNHTHTTQTRSRFVGKTVFIIAFAILGFIALQIPIARLAGSKTAFTLYDAFAPIAGAFLGSIPGVIAVFIMQAANFFLHGAHIEDAGTIIRFFPMLFGVWVFARARKSNLLIPLIAIAAFIAHPIGRQVWYFSLFWIIPIITHYVRDRFLFARAFDATFTAHAVGGALWIWTFSMPASVWQSLIPVVALERFVFAIGICITFIAASNLLYLIEKYFLSAGILHVDPRYVFHYFRNSYGAHTDKIT